MSRMKTTKQSLLIGSAVIVPAIMYLIFEEISEPKKLAAGNNVPETPVQQKLAQIGVKNSADNLHASQTNIKYTGTEEDKFERSEYLRLRLHDHLTIDLFFGGGIGSGSYPQAFRFFHRISIDANKFLADVNFIPSWLGHYERVISILSSRTRVWREKTRMIVKF